jgi:hypothetical protein
MLSCEYRFFLLQHPWFEVVLIFLNRLGTYYNATRSENKQEEVEKWIKETYQAIYEKLVKLGKTKDEDELSKFNVEVVLKP